MRPCVIIALGIGRFRSEYRCLIFINFYIGVRRTIFRSVREISAKIALFSILTDVATFCIKFRKNS